MSLEEALDRNTAATEKLTAAVLSKGGTNSSADGETNKRGPGRPPKAKGLTPAEVKAIAERVRDEKSRSEAIALLKKFGAEKVAALDEKHYAAFVAACEVALEGGDDDTGEGDGDDI